MMFELLLALATEPAAVQGQSVGDVGFGASGLTIRGDRAPYTGAFFVIVFNSGSEPDRLLSVSSPVSGTVTSEVVVYDASMRPIPQTDVMSIPPGGRIMVRANMGLSTSEFPRGVPVTVRFERAGRMDVTVSPRREASLPPPVAVR
ncbi:MAG: copper chaperone PCu(A)C [Brevundimonas sp.]|nr:MAG: copper chaperone PCu(A)C [Brevundimonas sp.]